MNRQGKKKANSKAPYLWLGMIIIVAYSFLAKTKIVML